MEELNILKPTTLLPEEQSSIDLLGEIAVNYSSEKSTESEEELTEIDNLSCETDKSSCETDKSFELNNNECLVSEKVYLEFPANTTSSSEYMYSSSIEITNPYEALNLFEPIQLKRKTNYINSNSNKSLNTKLGIR